MRIGASPNSSAAPLHEHSHLTQGELARRWRISPRTLERWRWLKTGPSYLRIGGRIVYRLEDIQSFEVGRRCDTDGDDGVDAREAQDVAS